MAGVGLLLNTICIVAASSGTLQSAHNIDGVDQLNSPKNCSLSELSTFEQLALVNNLQLMDVNSGGGTPLNFTVYSSSINGGFWGLDHGCCSGRRSEIFGRPNPMAYWSGEPEGTRSFVIMIDDMDDNANLHWIVHSIDSREHVFHMGRSGSCWWWYMWHNRCPPNTIPAAGREFPNRWGQWRFSGFCPPAQIPHRYRMRVFAQSEFHQWYLDHSHTGWHNPPVVRSSDDLARQLMPGNLGVAELIGVYQRPSWCGGPAFPTGQEPPLDGLVGDYDFGTKTLRSMVDGAPDLADIGARCGKPARFVMDTTRTGASFTLDFAKGTGIAIPNADLFLPKGDEMQYSIVMDVKLRRASCWVRIIDANNGENPGVYYCDGVRVHPGGRAGARIWANRWTMIGISVSRADKRVRFFVDDKQRSDFTMSKQGWDDIFYIKDAGEADTRSATDPLDNVGYISLFNDCGKDCCNHGSQAGAKLRRMWVFDRMIDQNVMQALWTQAHAKDYDSTDVNNMPH